MLSLIDRCGGKVSDLAHCRTPPHPHVPAFTGALHPQCSAAQPGCHPLYVTKEHSAACVGKRMPKPSAIARLYSVSSLPMQGSEDVCVNFVGYNNTVIFDILGITLLHSRSES